MLSGMMGNIRLIAYLSTNGTPDKTARLDGNMLLKDRHSAR